MPVKLRPAKSLLAVFLHATKLPDQFGLLGWLAGLWPWAGSRWTTSRIYIRYIFRQNIMYHSCLVYSAAMIQTRQIYEVINGGQVVAWSWVGAWCLLKQKNLNMCNNFHRDHIGMKGGDLTPPPGSPIYLSFQSVITKHLWVNFHSTGWQVRDKWLNDHKVASHGMIACM